MKGSLRNASVSSDILCLVHTGDSAGFKTTKVPHSSLLRFIMHSRESEGGHGFCWHKSQASGGMPPRNALWCRCHGWL